MINCEAWRTTTTVLFHFNLVVFAPISDFPSLLSSTIKILFFSLTPPPSSPPPTLSRNSSSLSPLPTLFYSSPSLSSLRSPLPLPLLRPKLGRAVPTLATRAGGPPGASSLSDPASRRGAVAAVSRGRGAFLSMRGVPITLPAAVPRSALSPVSTLIAPLYAHAGATRARRHVRWRAMQPTPGLSSG